MDKIWDIFKKEEEKKKPLSSYFGGGVSTIVKEVEGKKKARSPIWDIFEAKADVGISAKGIGGATLAKPVEVPSYWGISDLTKPKQISPEHQQMEILSLKMKELPTRKEQESFAYEVLTGKKVDDIFTLPLEERKKALSLMTQLQRTAVTTTEKFYETIGNIGWVGALSIMGIQAISALGKTGIHIKDKLITGKELKNVLARAKENYIPETGKFKATLSNNDYEIIKRLYSYFKQTGLTEQSRRYLEKIVEKTGGLSFPQQVNIFGGKLYAGVPIDEMVKSIVKVGKLTQDIVNQLKVMNPVDTGLVFQQLSIASPAIATKLSSQFVELMPQKITKIPKVEEEMTPEEKPEKVNPMAFSSDPLAISRELESYPDDSALIARKAELIFKQHIEGKDIDYPINIAKQELELAKINLIEKFGNDYPEAEKIIKRTEILEKQLGKVKPEVKPEKIMQDLAEKVKPISKEPSIRDDYKLIDKWIQKELPKQKAIDISHKLKMVSKQIREGNVPKDVLEAMHRQFEPTKDQETGERLWWNDVIDDPTAYPRTGTLMDFYNAYENLDIIEREIKPEIIKPTPKVIPKELEPLAEEARKYESAEEFGNNTPGYISTKTGKLLENISDPLDWKDLTIKKLIDLKNNNPNYIVSAKIVSGRRGGVSRQNITVNKLLLPDNLKDFYKEATKVEPKPPVVPTISELTEKKIIPATMEEAKEILKVDPKKPSVPKIKLAEEMVKKKVSLADIEAVKEEKIDVKKPRDIIVALRDIKAVKKEVVVEEEIPKVEIKKPEIELATLEQIKKAHAIAGSKAMISEKGKMKPQYREIAKTFTKQKSIKKMTKEEAETFIDMLNRLPEPKYKDGKLVAPSIPRTMKLTTEGFFQKKYGEPTPIWLLEDQTYYATQLGIHPLVEPFEKGKMEFDLEFRQSSHLVDRMVNKLNTISKTSAFAKIKSKVKNIPTKAESKMAELINKHETTPEGLSEKEEDVFKYFRNLSKDIWRRENEVREKVDLPPIKYKQAYFRHTANAMAKEMLEGKYPFPQGIKYWGEKMVGKKIFNPMEFHRKLSDDLLDIWSKDIRAVTKAMLWNGLKEIYLAQPAKFLNEQLNAISKDLLEYKNLTPREKAAYDQTRVMPASTRKWLVNYINQVIKGQETELDASLNRIVTKSGLKGIFDKVLSPFGRSIGRKPITNLFSLSGRMIISGVMGWVPRQIMRNSFQPVQNLALYGVKATIKSYLPASVDKNLKELMSESLFRKSYTGYEELPTNLMAKLEKVWLGPYGIVAVNNAKLGMKAAYWNILELIENPKFRKHGWADPQRTKDTPKGFLYPSEKAKLLKEMEFGASCTQYQYIPIGMPGVFRYKALIPLTRLQSWWMNYFAKFNREAIYRGLKGRPSWAGEDGPTFPWSRRVNYLKYLIIGGAILISLGYKRSFMLGVAPTYLSPAGQLALGIYNYAVADEEWKKKKALRQIYYSWKAFIPGSLAWRDFLSVWKGEKDLEEILFYGKKRKRKAIPKSEIWEEIEGKKGKSDIWKTFDTKKKTKSDVWKLFD